jgi:hypothetical protein
MQASSSSAVNGLQVLKLRVQYLLQTLEALQQQCSSLREERDQLSVQLQQLSVALRHVFPYSHYRQLRQDLSSLSDADLVDHFTNYGIIEGVDLSFSSIEQRLHELTASLEESSARADLLNQKSARTSAQLDLLNDLVSKTLFQH